MKTNVVILDCYTDEPSGYGVRPFLGSHQIHLSQALGYSSIAHNYLTIDDLRFANDGDAESAAGSTDIARRNVTKNCNDALDILSEADTIYVIMGCFTEYAYFSCKPPYASEVENYLRDCRARIVAYYVLGSSDTHNGAFSSSSLLSIFDEVEYGNAYRHVLASDHKEMPTNLLAPDYDTLSRIAKVPPPILQDLITPIIAEIETGTGCNHPTCAFCIEARRISRVQYRSPDAIIDQVRTLYLSGVRHFRLGRQPNFFHFQRQNVYALEKLLSGIREACPDIRMLHIDNVNPIEVTSKKGREFARIIAKYCTSGNVAAMGVESFDPKVREQTRIAGSVDNVIAAIEIINEFGSERDSSGLPLFLPGINLIHGLPGSSRRTHDYNLAGLRRIRDRGLMTYRTYYRNLTDPYGITLRDSSSPRPRYFDDCFRDIVDDYVIPMQDSVYPTGTTLSGDWEVIQKDGVSIGRMLGTSSIKVEFDNKIPDTGAQPLDVVITGNSGYRLLTGTVC